MSWRHRLATHAGLVSALLWLCLCVDLAAGLNWLVLGLAADAPAYVPAEKLMPIPVWGFLFVGWAVGGMFTHRNVHPKARAYLVRNVGAALWFCWFVFFVWAASTQPLVSWFGAIVAAGLLLLHRITGHALAARSQEATRCGK